MQCTPAGRRGGQELKDKEGEEDEDEGQRARGRQEQAACRFFFFYLWIIGVQPHSEHASVPKPVAVPRPVNTAIHSLDDARTDAIVLATCAGEQERHRKNEARKPHFVVL